MKYLQSRLAQPTTWLGLAIAGFSLYTSGGQITPEITTSILTALGLVHINEAAKA